MNKLFRILLFLLIAFPFNLQTAQADSPWTEHESYLEKTGGKLLHGIKNGVFFWLQPFKEAKSTCYDEAWTGFMHGIGQGVHYGVSGLVQLATFPIPVDFPDIGNGLTEVPAPCPKLKSANHSAASPTQVETESSGAWTQRKTDSGMVWESEPKLATPAPMSNPSKQEAMPSAVVRTKQDEVQLKMPPKKPASLPAPKRNQQLTKGTVSGSSESEINWDEAFFENEAAPAASKVSKTVPEKITPKPITPPQLKQPEPSLQIEDVNPSRDEAMDQALSELIKLEAAMAQ